MNDKKSLCVIGAGKIFQNFHMQAIINTNYFKIKYIIDKNIDIARKYANILGAVGIDNLEEVKDCETYFVATPPSTRLTIFNAIKSKAKYIIFEKPIAFNSQVVDEIEKESKKFGIDIFVAHTRRFFPNLNFIRQLIESGFIEKPFELFIYEGGPFNWTTESNYMMKQNPEDQGIIHDVGAHIYDYFLLILKSFGINYENLKILKSEVDYDLLPNNVGTDFIINDGKNMSAVSIKLSRSLLLMNKIILKDKKKSVISRSLLDTEVTVMVNDKTSFVIPVPKIKDLKFSLEDAFDKMWYNLYLKISGNEYESPFYDISLETVKNTVRIIDEVIKEKKVINIENYFKTFGYEQPK